MNELILIEPCVVLLVGAAGAGKSTFARRWFQAAAVLSSDALREAIGGDAANQRVTGSAFAALHRTLDRRLATGRLAVIDATNVTAAARASIRRVAQRRDVPVVAIVFDLPEGVIRARNAGRDGRVVPDDVVTRHVASLREAVDRRAFDREGYGAVIHLTDAAAVDALVVTIST